MQKPGWTGGAGVIVGQGGGDVENGELSFWVCLSQILADPDINTAVSLLAGGVIVWLDGAIVFRSIG